jgi:hypothetical protein
MIRIQSKVSDYFLFQNLSKQKEITHFVSTNIRKHNETIVHDFDLCFSTGISKDAVLRNREILALETEIPLINFVMQEQVHSDKVQIVGNEHRGMGVFNKADALPDSDAMITDHKQICLFLFAADCVPVLFYDPKNNVIGAAHSGWKGTVGKIAQKTVLAMKTTYGTNPEDVMVGIGPSITVHNYEVGEEVVAAVEQSFGTKKGFLEYNTKRGKHRFNLQYAVRMQLIDIGVKNENIEVSGLCTFDRDDLFFSARSKKNTGRFGAGIMIL